ncbi:MAG: hypothetical protein ACR2FG_04185 [Marmoricola sp.]
MFDLSTCRLVVVQGELAGYDGAGVDDAERIDQLRALEELKAAAAAAQARVTAAFEASQRAEQSATGVRSDRQGQGVGSQVALPAVSPRTVAHVI